MNVSVIIACYNGAALIPEAIRSAQAQTVPPREIIVVDDGAGAAEAVGRMHPSIRVLDNSQRGPVPARNMGVSAATGDCICVLDDDDWFTDAGYFAKAALAADRGGHFCYSDGELVFEDGRPSLPFAFHADADTLTRDNTILISGVVYRRGLHAELGAFDEELPFYWDWDWYLRVARAGHELIHIQRPAVAIRVHARNMSGDSLEGPRRANLDRFSTKHGLAPIPLKNHLDIATQAPGKAPPAQENT